MLWLLQRLKGPHHEFYSLHFVQYCQKTIPVSRQNLPGVWRVCRIHDVERLQNMERHKMSYSNPMHHSTPGPWAIESRPTGGFDVDGAFDVQRERVAFAVNPSNAALIAAAPDLLAALDELLRVTVDAMLADGFTLTDEQQAARDQALAAIAKANPC